MDYNFAPVKTDENEVTKLNEEQQTNEKKERKRKSKKKKRKQEVCENK